MDGTHNNLSPQLQLLIALETEQHRQAEALVETNKRVDGICDVVALDSTSWRKDTQALIKNIVFHSKGKRGMKEVQGEIYSILEFRAGVDLDRRLYNKQNRMRKGGVAKSSVTKINRLDVIADDKQLIEIYTGIVKDMAIAAGVAMTEQEG